MVAGQALKKMIGSRLAAAFDIRIDTSIPISRFSILLALNCLLLGFQLPVDLPVGFQLDLPVGLSLLLFPSTALSGDGAVKNTTPTRNPIFTSCKAPIFMLQLHYLMRMLLLLSTTRPVQSWSHQQCPLYREFLLIMQRRTDLKISAVSYKSEYRLYRRR